MVPAGRPEPGQLPAPRKFLARKDEPAARPDENFAGPGRPGTNFGRNRRNLLEAIENSIYAG